MSLLLTGLFGWFLCAAGLAWDYPLAAILLSVYFDRFWRWLERKSNAVAMQSAREAMEGGRDD